MPRVEPEEFSIKDLFIDVKLEACIGGSTYDFLGRKLFSTEFFRESIGFGITSIDIEVNTSLQPLVTVVFKDLYGQTIFGGQKERANLDGQSIDYSVLFNWPPPKFLFSFKGYLGKPTSWVLNLKRTSTSFNSSDGSYELTCEFVPNQWGFFADLPYLYLLAAKTLRKDQLGENATPEEKKSITSVFDLIKIGKQVEVKTQDTTKEFDELVKQLGSLKSNVGRAVAVSSIVDFGEEIDGVVNNRPVVAFQKMVFPSLSELDTLSQGNLGTKEKLEEKLGIATELSKLNTYLLLSVKFDYGGKLENGFTKFSISSDYASFDVNNPDVSSAKNQTISFINKNIDKIDDEIKRLVFASSESKLEKITIGEIFSQLAKDAAYVMGSILDAGLDGYRGDVGRQALRDELSDDLIGQSFPLIINKKGEEVPATKANLEETSGADIGVDEHEMSFVRNFITAVSEGIARDLPSDDATGAGQDDSVLKQRINNIEMTSNNPYKSNYKSIVTNILVRGGIVGYMTRSNDPNLPGDYGSIFIDNDGKQQIEEIAVRDVENITDSIINNLSDIDKHLLKRFYNFILKFYSSDGEDLIDKEGEKVVEIHGNNIAIVANYPVVMSTNSDGTEDLLKFSTLWRELKTPSTLSNVSLDENGDIKYGVVELSNPTPTNAVFDEPIPAGIINAQNPLSFVDDATFNATRIMNNGLSYCYPNADKTGGKYWAVLFRGNSNAKAQEANTSPTDGEYKNEDKDATDPGQNEPLGYVAINSKYDEDDDVLDRVESLEDYRDALGTSTILAVINPLAAITAAQIQGRISLVLDYETLGDPTPSFYGATPSEPGLEQFLWTNKIAKDDVEAAQIGSNPQNLDDVEVAGDFGWTVCAHQVTGSDRDLVFGLFNNSHEGRSQRIYIRKMCETLKKNFEKLEDEQNQIIGSVLGKAGEQEDAIYKQMHTLFHQWQTLSYSDKRDGSGALCGDIDEHRGGEGSSDANTFGVARNLEERFGSNHKDLMKNNTIEINGELKKLTDSGDSNGVPDGTFIYDYPNQRIRGVAPDEDPVQVRDAIINLEPLYKGIGTTSVLNIIQNICTKNNFLFIPIPGNPDYLNVSGIYSPSSKLANIEIKNFFHVLFTPTPESRTKTKNKDGTPLSLTDSHKNYDINSFAVKYGHPDNQIVSNIQVGTDDNKVTAESIINLQRIVDNENQNKKVTTDCSMLPVLAGRSYKASLDMLGNAQVYPMQFFFLENSPLFGGLYQVMTVRHSIIPNDMKTTAEGIRMRFSPGGGYGAIKPVTLDTFRDLGALADPIPFSKSDRQKLSDDSAAGAGGAGDTGSVVAEGDNVPVGGYTKSKMQTVVKGKGYKWFDSNKDFELNIVGIRNTSTGSAVTNKFDDYITVSYKEGGKWKFWSWPCTTQPGTPYVKKPLRADGVAILKPGQYKDSHMIRKHAGKYEALGQRGSLTVFRDNNKDLNYDLDNSKLQVSSNLGINIHHSSYTAKSWNVNTWSAGCQVFQDIKDFNAFMAIARKAKALHGNKFTYTLVESVDIA